MKKYQYEIDEIITYQSRQCMVISRNFSNAGYQYVLRDDKGICYFVYEYEILSNKRGTEYRG